MWFSPNGDKLAYASFNDEHVNVMTIAYYGEPGTIASQYPEMLYLRYPKVGDKLVLVLKIALVELERTDLEINEYKFWLKLFVSIVSNLFLEMVLSITKFYTYFYFTWNFLVKEG